MANPSRSSGKTYVIEHLDPELEEWSQLEYSAIASECHEAGARFLLSSVPSALELPEQLLQTQGLTVEARSVEELFPPQTTRVCLLDPAASQDLCPEDESEFDVLLFGGILGKHRRFMAPLLGEARESQLTWA